jgi:homoserine O-acetyltransferase
MTLILPARPAANLAPAPDVDRNRPTAAARPPTAPARPAAAAPVARATAPTHALPRSPTLRVGRAGAAAVEPPAAPAAALDAAAERGDCWLTLPLRHAGPRTVRIAYECIGPARAPAVLVLGGISAGRHVAASRRYPEPGWWPAQVGPGRALDPTRLRLVGIDWLGADGALDAPIDSADQADALAAMLDELAIPRLRLLVGASYGAMVGLSFAARHGERLRHLLAISGGHRAHPHASALRSVQRAIIRLAADPDQRLAALAVARQLAMIGYRTPDELSGRFSQGASVRDGMVRVAAQDWLHGHGQRHARHTSATAALRLSESIDLHDVDPGVIRTPTTVVAVPQDGVVPVADLCELVERLAAPAQLRLLPSPYGNDAFLKEHDAIAAAIEHALSAAAGGRP